MIREAITTLAEEGRDLGKDEAAAMARIMQVEAAGPDGASVTLDALVDTGATYTLAPASVLRRLGVEPIGRQTFLIADGSRVEHVLLFTPQQTTHGSRKYKVSVVCNHGNYLW